MALPDPVPGLVFRYEYLWADEASAGLGTAVKERPACIVLASDRRQDDVRVVIVPITHVRPADETPAIELSDRLKKHLQLDGQRSWVILSEVNTDFWPSPDMRQVPNRPGIFHYGLLPTAMVTQMRQMILQARAEKRLRTVDRT